MSSKKGLRLKTPIAYVLIGNKNYSQYHLGRTCIGVFNSEVKAYTWLKKFHATLGFGTYQIALDNTRVESTSDRRNK